jgi:trk system potassium uptake protein TrkA
MKQVAVFGLGDFGVAVLKTLRENRVTVLALDIDRSRADAVRDIADHVVIADMTHASALDKLGLLQMDAVVVATSAPMSTSILAVLRLKDLGVGRIIAKAENEDHATVLGAIGVSEVVIPETDSATRVANKISWTNVVSMIELSSGCSIMEVLPPEDAIGKSLRDSSLRERYYLEVLGMREAPGEPLDAIPNPDRIITADCTLVVFGEDKRLAKLRRAAERRKD